MGSFGVTLVTIMMKEQEERQILIQEKSFSRKRFFQIIDVLNIVIGGAVAVTQMVERSPPTSGIRRFESGHWQILFTINCNENK